MIDTDLLQDLTLILISGLACLYCGMLNRRLKKLQSLKTGVGASIVSLTDAITQTNKAAKDAQSTTLETVTTLRHLLAKAESAAPKIDALIAELANSTDAAMAQHERIGTQIEEELTTAVEKAQFTAASLLTAVSDVESYVERVKRTVDIQTTENVTSLDEAREQKLDIFSVVSL